MEAKETAKPVALIPETGVSISRRDEDALRLRERLERPARIGRLALAIVGVLAAAAGVATWITSGSNAGIAVAAFGAVLILLGVAQHLLYRRELAHWPTDVLLQDVGLELVLPNGEVRGAMWSDPDFALQLVARPAHVSSNREFLLIWLAESRIPPVEITGEGFDLLRQIASTNGLIVSQTQRGSRSNPTQSVTIRQRPHESPLRRTKTAGVDNSE